MCELKQHKFKSSRECENGQERKEEGEFSFPWQLKREQQAGQPITKRKVYMELFPYCRKDIQQLLYWMLKRFAKPTMMPVCVSGMRLIY